MRGKDRNRAWERVPNLQNQSRFLELADVTLGLKKKNHHEPLANSESEANTEAVA
jgi:hypothetical protein